VKGDRERRSEDEYGAKNVYTCILNAKMIPVENIPGIGGGGR
jgi:hypothetical protein